MSVPLKAVVVEKDKLIEDNKPKAWFAFYSIDEGVMYLLYSAITFIFITTLGFLIAFLFFTWLHLSSDLKKFPGNILYQENMSKYYESMFCGLITVIIIFSLLSATILCLAANSICKNPKNPLRVTASFFRSVMMVDVGLCIVCTWNDWAGQQQPPMINFLTVGLLVYCSILLGLHMVLRRLQDRRLTVKNQNAADLKATVVETK